MRYHCISGSNQTAKRFKRSFVKSTCQNEFEVLKVYFESQSSLDKMHPPPRPRDDSEHDTRQLSENTMKIGVLGTGQP